MPNAFYMRRKAKQNDAKGTRWTATIHSELAPDLALLKNGLETTLHCPAVWKLISVERDAWFERCCHNGSLVAVVIRLHMSYIVSIALSFHVSDVSIAIGAHVCRSDGHVLHAFEVCDSVCSSSVSEMWFCERVGVENSYFYILDS